MFNNQLTTLREESGPSRDTDSGDDTDDESPRSGGRVRRANQMLGGSFEEPKSSGSFDAKFIKSRWEYSLQMMTCGSLKNSDCMMQVSVRFCISCIDSD